VVYGEQEGINLESEELDCVVSLSKKGREGRKGGREEGRKGGMEEGRREGREAERKGGTSERRHINDEAKTKY
jgi:hypothetical protein